MKLDIYNNLFVSWSHYTSYPQPGYYGQKWYENQEDITIINGCIESNKRQAINYFINELKNIKRVIIQTTPCNYRLKRKHLKTVNFYGAEMTKVTKNFYCMNYGNIYTIGDYKIVSLSNDEDGYKKLHEILPELQKINPENVFIFMVYGDGKLYEKLKNEEFPLFDRIVFGEGTWKDQSEFNKNFIEPPTENGKPVVFGAYDVQLDTKYEPCTYNSVEPSVVADNSFVVVKHFGEKAKDELVVKKITPPSDEYFLYYEPHLEYYCPFEPESCRSNVWHILNFREDIEIAFDILWKCIKYVVKWVLIFYLIFFVLLPLTGAY